MAVVPWFSVCSNPLGTTHGGCQLMLAALVAKRAVRVGSAERAQVVWTLGNSLDLEAAAGKQASTHASRQLLSQLLSPLLGLVGWRVLSWIIRSLALLVGRSWEYPSWA